MIRTLARIVIVAASFTVAATARETTAPPELVDWIRSTAVPIKTVDAGSGFDDLAALKTMIGERVRVVGLGEATHGTREHFQAKHRLLEFLVHEMGYTVFGIEASMPDCIAINDYVLEGEGDPEKAVAGQGFWTWSTEEVLAMVKWMREYNADPAHTTKLKFYGYDMQNEQSAANAVLKYLARVDEAAAAELRPVVAPLLSTRFMAGAGTEAEFQAAGDAAKELARRLDANREAYVVKSSADDFAIYRRCADVCSQALELAGEIRGTSSSLGRMRDMQLMGTIAQDAEALAEMLKEHLADAAPGAQALLQSLTNLQRFSTAYATADDAQKSKWEESAAEICRAVEAAKGQIGESDWTKLDRRARDVADFLLVYRELTAKAAERGDAPRSTENVRDRCMAENIAWILETEGAAAKIAVWAHNGHVMYVNPRPGEGILTMGDYLRKMFADEYFVIGFSFNQGSFQAVPARTMTGGAGSLREWTVKEAKPESLDAALAAAKMPLFVLDVRAVATGAAAGVVRQWLALEHPMRMAGAVFDPALEATQFYRTVAPGKTFDAILFTDTTTRARPLATMPHASMGSDTQMTRPRVGVQLAEDSEPGIRITGIIEGLPAQAAGLKEGDRILKVGVIEIESMREFISTVAKYKVDEMVPMTILRDDKEVVVEVKLTASK